MSKETEEVNIELINLQLKHNENAIMEVKDDLKDMVKSYNTFNETMIQKVTMLETKLKQWSLVAVLVSTIIGAILKYNG